MKYIAIIKMGQNFNDIFDSFKTLKDAESKLKELENTPTDPNCFSPEYKLVTTMKDILHYAPRLKRTKVIEDWFTWVGAPSGNTNAQKLDLPKDANVRMRLPQAYKNAWVKQAQKEGMKLTDWVTKTCNENLNK